jgi:hypothetical protein
MKRLIGFAGWVLCVLAVGPVVQARTYIVATSGGDYATIAAGVSAAQAGDTVKVLTGTYAEAVTSVRAGSATLGRIVIKAVPRRTVSIASAALSHNYVRLEGFQINNAQDVGSSITVTANGVDVVDNYVTNTYNALSVNGQDLYLGYNHFHKCQESQLLQGRRILVEYNATERVFMHRTGWDCDYSRFSGDSITFRGNRYFGTIEAETGDAHLDCWQFFDNGGTSANNINFEDNFCSECDEGIMGEAHYYESSGNFTFRNNIFYNCGAWGICLQDIPYVYIYNNLFYNETGRPGVFGAGASEDATHHVYIKNNIFYNLSDRAYAYTGAGSEGDYNMVYLCMAPSTVGAHDRLNTNPLLVRPESLDFRLQPLSPAVDAGVDVGLQIDRDGMPRPQGPAGDIGPYEFDKIPPLAPTALQSPSQSAHVVNLSWIAPAAALDGDLAMAYVIRRGGVQVGTSTALAFSDSNLLESTTYDYAVHAVDDMGNISTGAATGSFQTIGDAVGPILQQALSLSLTRVQVFFDEPVEQATSEAVTNYQLSGGVTVSSAVRQADLKSVIVTTSGQTEGNQYTITVGNVRDASAAHNTMTSTQKQFTAMFKFEDDFEAGNLAKWTPASSSVWSVTDDAGDKSLFINAAVPAERLLVNRTYGVLSFDADIKGYGASVYRNLSIIIGLQDTSNYYHINFAGAANTTYNGIFKVVNKVESRLATTAALLTETAQYHHVRVTWNGATGEIKAYFDQSYTPAFSAVDTTYRSGTCGVWSKGSKQGYFDNVEVVARVRTDNFGQVGVQDETVRLSRDRTDLRLINPCRIADLTRIKDLVILDLAGNRIQVNDLLIDGIYLVQTARRGQWQKLLVL